jgi:hypothetical protein
MRTRFAAMLCALVITFGVVGAEAAPANAGISSAAEKIARRVGITVAEARPLVFQVRPSWSPRRFAGWLKRVNWEPTPELRATVRAVVVERRFTGNEYWDDVFIRGTICDVLAHVFIFGELPGAAAVETALLRRVWSSFYNYFQTPPEKYTATARSVRDEVRNVLDMDIPTASAEILRYLWCA